MFKVLKVAMVVSVISFLMIAAVPVNVEASTNGATYKVIAKGSLYNHIGELVAENVWFTFAMYNNNDRVQLGHNEEVDRHDFYEVRVLGNAGTINSITGPTADYGDWTVHILEITELYTYGSSVTSYTFFIEIVILKPGLPNLGSVGSVGPSPKLKSLNGLNASAFDMVGMLGAVLIAMMLIAGVLLADRRRKV